VLECSEVTPEGVDSDSDSQNQRVAAKRDLLRTRLLLWEYSSQDWKLLYHINEPSFRLSMSVFFF
jgi:hypothetical protein